MALFLCISKEKSYSTKGPDCGIRVITYILDVSEPLICSGFEVKMSKKVGPKSTFRDQLLRHLTGYIYCHIT